MSAILEYYIENGNIRNTNEFIQLDKGKIVYEVLKVLEGVPLFLDEHLQRFNRSFSLLNIEFKYSSNDIKEFINKLIETNSIKNGNIKITYETDSENLKVFTIKHFYPTEEMYNEGVKTIFYHGERHNPNAKVADDNFREKVTSKIKENNAYEAVLVNNDGDITEGSKSNIFVVKDNIFYTSEIKDVLPGVTRGKVIEILKANSFDFIEKNIKYSDIKDGDSMFITGTSPDILPIKSVDEIKLNTENNEMRRLMRLFNDEIKSRRVL